MRDEAKLRANFEVIADALAPFEVLGLGDGEEDLDKELVQAGVLDRTKSTENRTMD